MNALSTTDLAQEYGLSPAQLQLIRTMCVAPDAPDDILRLHMHLCKTYGFDPMGNMLVWQKRRDKRTNQDRWTKITTIDGFRSLAADTGDFQGRVGPFFSADGEKWSEVWTDAKKPPAYAKVGIWREGFREALFTVCNYESYCAKYNGQPSNLWATMPEVMLAKCAEAGALRAAFPKKLAGLYVSEEMHQADNAPAALSVPVAGQNALPVPKPSPSAAKDAENKDRVIAKALAAGVITLPAEFKAWVLATGRLDKYGGKLTPNGLAEIERDLDADLANLAYSEPPVAEDMLQGEREATRARPQVAREQAGGPQRDVAAIDGDGAPDQKRSTLAAAPESEARDSSPLPVVEPAAGAVGSAAIPHPGRTCLICDKPHIPRGVDWPHWRHGSPYDPACEGEPSLALALEVVTPIFEPTPVPESDARSAKALRELQGKLCRELGLSEDRRKFMILTRYGPSAEGSTHNLSDGDLRDWVKHLEALKAQKATAKNGD